MLRVVLLTRNVENVIFNRRSRSVASRQLLTRWHAGHFSTARSWQRSKAGPPADWHLLLSQEQPKAKTKSSSRPVSFSNHHNLASFLQAHDARRAATTDPDERAKLSQSSVYLGTRYEYLIQKHLQDSLGFQLTRIGKTGDQGVDLIGTWTLPVPKDYNGTATTFRVIVQAKRIAANRTLQPRMIRELEGTLVLASSMQALKEAFVAHGICHRSNSMDTMANEAAEAEPEADLSHLRTLGVLAATRPLTEGALNAMTASRRPMMYMLLEDSSLNKTSQHEVDGTTLAEEGHNDYRSQVGDSETTSLFGSAVSTVPTITVRQVVWNSAASSAGLDGYDVIRHYAVLDGSNSDNADGLEGAAVLAYQGRPIYTANTQT